LAVPSDFSYVQQIIDWQPRLYGFVLSLVGNRGEADDILQDVNVVLLRKQEAFQVGADFGSWAMRIAFLEVQDFRKRHQRAGARFSDAAVEAIAAKAEQGAAGWEPYRGALRQCLEKVPAAQRELLELRYGGSSVELIAAKLGRTIGSISQTLYRIRGRLADCVRRKLAPEQRLEQKGTT
jgi:RNA polymerase sigma-70 factor (ECF subfamily)